MIRILVDCTNTYSGGAKRHLSEIFGRLSDVAANSQFTFIGAVDILAMIPDHNDQMSKVTHTWLNGSSWKRHLWRVTALPRLVRRFDLVFYPGGTVSGRPRRSVVMCRNMLPFMRSEYLRYGFSLYVLKFEVLRWLHRRSYRRASGLIFLSEMAREIIMPRIGRPNDAKRVRPTLIPHGVDENFRVKGISSLAIFPKSSSGIRLLYISGFDVYKNQDTVLEAVGVLRKQGLNVEIRFVGGGNRVALRGFQRKRKKLDPNGEWSHLLGEVAHAQLCDLYDDADLFVYASTCENLPNILLEAMARKIPIACSNRRPMVDVLGDGGVYFDPRDPQDLASAIRRLINSQELRHEIQLVAYERAKAYDWDVCASRTFEYLHEVATA